ncbi:MAG TPA: hypothetical protein VF210_07420 [Pseudomonadales bacterium]
MRPRLATRLTRLAWFVLLWAGGVTAAALVAQGIRWWLSGA